MRVSSKYIAVGLLCLVAAWTVGDNWMPQLFSTTPKSEQKFPGTNESHSDETAAPSSNTATKTKDSKGVMKERPGTGYDGDEPTTLMPMTLDDKSLSKRSSRHAAEVLSSMKAPKGNHYKDFWLVISQSLHLAVTIVPKVMCSSIRAALNVQECGKDHQASRCAEVRKNSRLKTVNLGNMTHIAFVRDPFERAFSAYENSDSNRFIQINHCHNTSVCTFSEWVNELAKNPGQSFKNEHFLPQTRILQFDQIHYHYIFRLSSPADQHFFWGKLLKRKQSIHSNVNHNISNDTQYDGLEQFSAKTFQRLSKLYAQDLSLWSKVLQFGTPREPNEHTLYDYFISKYN